MSNFFQIKILFGGVILVQLFLDLYGPIKNKRSNTPKGV